MMAFFNGKRVSKTLIAAMLTIAMVVTYAVPMTVYATTPTGGSYEQIVKGTNKTEMTVKNADGSVEMSKTIAGTNTENEFEITLEVQTKNQIQQNKINAVLVIDTSGSMSSNDRLKKAKAAAKTLVETLLPNSDSSKNVNKVGLVSFGGSSSSDQSLTNDRSKLNGSGKAIDDLSASGGTNIQAGIRAAQNMLASADPGARKFIILLSDGAPTYSYKGTAKTALTAGTPEIVTVGNVTAPNYRITTFDTDTRKGNGSEYVLKGTESSYYYDYDKEYTIGTSTVADNGIPTISQAVLAKKSGIEIYAVGCELADQKNNSPYKTIKREEAVFTLTNCASDSDHYYDVANAGNLSTVFQNIAQQVLETKAGTVVDPMGDKVLFDSFTSNPNSGATYNAADNKFVWDLTKVTPVKNGQIFTYTLKYKVTLNTDADGFTAGTAYDTNGTTTLTYVTPTGLEQNENFISPKVKGNLPQFDVTIKYHTVSADGTVITPLGDAKDVTLTKVTKGSTYGDVAASYKNKWRGSNPDQLSPNEYHEGEIQASNTPVSSTYKVIDVYYKAKLKMPYKVNYYKDEVAAANLLNTTTSALSYTTGTAISSIGGGLENLFTPGNYKLKAVLNNNNGNALSSSPLSISEIAAQNIINVVYEAIPKHEYRVEYYLDTELQSNETITGSALEGAVVGGEVVVPKTFTNWKYSRTVFGDEGGTSIMIVSNPGPDQNVIRVYYAENDKYTYSIQHIAIDQNGVEHDITTAPGTSEFEGASIAKTAIAVLSPEQVKTYTGYAGKQYSHNGEIKFNGVVVGTDFKITNGTNVVKVYYTDAPIYGYTVKYYKDNAETPFETVPVAAQEGYYAGTTVAASEINTSSKTPENYHLDKVLEGTAPIGTTFTITSDGTVINVYYVEDSKYGYTVEYYAGGNLLTSVTPEDTYYAGTIIDEVDKGLNKPAGFILDKVVWGNVNDAESLTISSVTENNVIKVYYKAAEGTLFTVEHYKQLDDESYSDTPDATEQKYGVTNTEVLAEDYVKSSYTGYQYNPNVAGSVTSAQINGDGTTVLKLYYDQDLAPLRVKHYYGDEDVVTKDPVNKRIGSPVSVAQERRYGYKLDHIDVNGILYTEGTRYQGNMQSFEGEGLLVEFYYVKASMIELTRHYTNLTTNKTVDVPDDIGLANMVANLVESAKNVWEGITYKFVSATVKSEVAADVAEQLKTAVDDLKLVYAEIVETLTPEDIALADAQYEDAISGAAVTRQNAEDVLELKRGTLKTERDNDPTVAAALTVLTEAQGAYASAVGTVVPEGLAPASGATYDQILAEYDILIGAARTTVETETASYNTAVEAAIAAATTAEKQAFEDAQSALDSASALPAPDQLNFGDDTDGYNAAVEAYYANLAELSAAKTEAESALAAAEAAARAGAEADTALRATLTAAETALTELEGYKANFVTAVGELPEKAALDTAKQNHDDALTAALNRYLAAVAASDEQKAVDAAQKAYDETEAAAKAAYNQTIRTLVMAADPDLAAKLQAAEDALSGALAAAGVKDFGPDDIMLLEAYEFSTQMNYVVHVYYEYKEDPGNPENPENPENPGNPGNPGTPRDRDNTPSNNPPVIIRDEQVPAGPVEPTEDIVILDDQVPAGPLPKTGGLDALLLYGLGTLLAGGGFALRRKEKNK